MREAEIVMEIGKQKMLAYEKLHIPTKDEIMDEIIAIGKTIAEGRKSSKGCEDVIVLFVENNNDDWEFQGFIGDYAWSVDTDGNYLHIGDLVEMEYKKGSTFKEYVTRVLPKQKSITLSKGKLVRSYEKISPNKSPKAKGIFHFVSCIEEYYKSLNQTTKETEVEKL